MVAAVTPAGALRGSRSLHNLYLAFANEGRFARIVTRCHRLAHADEIDVGAVHPRLRPMATARLSVLHISTPVNLSVIFTSQSYLYYNYFYHTNWLD